VTLVAFYEWRLGAIIGDYRRCYAIGPPNDISPLTI